MRTVFFFLLLLNLAFFAWGQLGSGALDGEAQLLGQQVNPDSIRLLTPEQVAVLAAERPKVAPSPPPVVVPVAPPKSATCFNWGGFNPVEAARAEQALGQYDPPPKLSQQSVEEAANYWVYIPPRGNRQSAIRKTVELKNLGIAEFFILQDDPKYRFAISLGVFKSEEAAKAWLEYIRGKGVRTARVGYRETQVPKIYFTLRDLTDANLAKLNELRQTFPGSEVKECQAAENKT